MPINFPTSPVIGTPYTLNGRRYFWDGVKWIGAGQPVGGAGPADTGFNTRPVLTNELFVWDALESYEQERYRDGDYLVDLPDLLGNGSLVSTGEPTVRWAGKSAKKASSPGNRPLARLVGAGTFDSITMIMCGRLATSNTGYRTLAAAGNTGGPTGINIYNNSGSTADRWSVGWWAAGDDAAVGPKQATDVAILTWDATGYDFWVNGVKLLTRTPLALTMAEWIGVFENRNSPNLFPLPCLDTELDFALFARTRIDEPTALSINAWLSNRYNVVDYDTYVSVASLPPVALDHVWHRDDLANIYRDGGRVDFWPAVTGENLVRDTVANPALPVFRAANGGYLEFTQNSTQFLQALGISNAQPTTILLYTSTDGLTSPTGGLFDGVSSRNHIWASSSTQLQIFAGTGVNITATVSSATDRLIGGLFNGASSHLLLDDFKSAALNAGTSALTGFRLGANNTKINCGAQKVKWGGIAYRALSDQDVADILAYCQAEFP